jgi:vacuolar-type H+-ATPase subunit H
MPTLFHLFFLSNFNITDFLDKNEVYIREFAIGDYIKTASYVQKKRKLSSMLYLYRDYMYVDKKNTNYEKFIEKIEYLFPYYIKSRFSLNSNIQFKCDRFIRNELEKINTLNIKINEKKTVRRQLFNNFNSVDIPIITRYAESPIFPINENPITDNENDSENTIEEGEENENNNINETSNNNETQIETTVEVMVNNLINDTIIEINQDIENSQNIINNEELEGVLQIVPIHNTISNIIENNSNILNEIMDTDSDEEMFDEDFDY